MTKKKKSGFDLYNEAAEIMSACPSDAELEADPEAEEAWTERLIAWCDASDQKAEAYRAVHRAAVARADDFAKMADDFKRYSKREAKIAARVESIAILLLKGAEDMKGAPELDCADGTKVKLRRRKSKSVAVVDEASIPDDYWRTKRTVDKSGAARDLKAGKEIAGMELVEKTSEWVAWGL